MLTPSFVSKETPETSSKQTRRTGRQARAAGRVVHEHLGDGRFAARDEVRVGRDLLEQVRLAGAARSELDRVVVRHHERDHAGDAARPARARVNRAGSNPTLRRRRSRHWSSVKWAGPPTNVSSASRVDSWIGRTDSMRNG